MNEAIFEAPHEAATPVAVSATWPKFRAASAQVLARLAVDEAVYRARRMWPGAIATADQVRFVREFRVAR